MKFEPTKEQIGILRHALGLERQPQGEAYRRHYVVDCNSAEYGECLMLTASGLMTNHGNRGQLTGGSYLFLVTEEGEQVARAHAPKPPKLTPGQRRYQEYLDVAECFDSFLSFLRYRSWKQRVWKLQQIGFSRKDAEEAA